MKFAGFDGIVVKGRVSETRSTCGSTTGKPSCATRAPLWGKVTGEAERAIKHELGDNKIEVLQVGPAGEKLSRFAAIMNMRTAPTAAPAWAR